MAAIEANSGNSSSRQHTGIYQRGVDLDSRRRSQPCVISKSRALTYYGHQSNGRSDGGAALAALERRFDLMPTDIVMRASTESPWRLQSDQG